MVKLHNITKDNWFECTQLEITDEQKKFFPAAPVYWLAECRYMNNWYEYAIYNDDKMIGFTVFGFDEDLNEYEICAFMIDKKYQGNGYGKDALNQLLDIIKTTHNRNKVYIFNYEGNFIASKFYESSGFFDTGERFNGKIIRCKDL